MEFTFTTADYVADARYLFELLADNFPFREVKRVQLGFDLDDEWQKLITKAANCTTPEHFLEQVAVPMLTICQNGHTSLVPTDRFKTYLSYNDYMSCWRDVITPETVAVGPSWQQIIDRVYGERAIANVVVAYVDGEYTIIDGPEMARFGLSPGDAILSIDGQDPHRWARTQIQQARLCYDFRCERAYVDLVTPASTGGAIPLIVQTKDGTRDARLQKVPQSQHAGPYGHNKANTASPSDSGNLTLKVLMHDCLAYIGFRRMGGQSSWQTDAKTIGDFLGTVWHYPVLILDIRGNQGGSDNYWMQNIVAPLVGEELSATFFVLPLLNIQDLPHWWE